MRVSRRAFVLTLSLSPLVLAACEDGIDAAFGDDFANIRSIGVFVNTQDAVILDRPLQPAEMIRFEKWERKDGWRFTITVQNNIAIYHEKSWTAPQSEWDAAVTVIRNHELLSWEPHPMPGAFEFKSRGFFINGNRRRNSHEWSGALANGLAPLQLVDTLKRTANQIKFRYL